MQKFYKLKTLLMICIMAVLGMGQTWGAEEMLTFSDLGLSDATKLTSYERTNFTISFGGSGTAAAYYNSGSAARIYTSNTFTFTAKGTGVKITKIVFTTTGSSYRLTTSNTSASEGTITTDQWTGDASEVTFTRSGSGQVRMTSVTVTYSVPTKYTVSLAGSGTVTGGTISASPTSAIAGTTISLTATPSAGYVFASWTVTDADAGSVTVTNNQFTMPAKNVTVDATFNEDDTVYDVNVSDETGGTISVDKSAAKSGEVVTLTATLDAGYSLVSWIVEDENGDPVATTPVTDKQCTFVMPSSDVLVSAVYKAIHTVSYSVCGIAQTPVQRLDGEQLNLPTPASVNGKAFVGWSTTSDVASPSFVENTAAVTSDLTLYAIFGPKIVYKLVEADQADWRGQYLIAYNSTTFADGRKGGTGGTDTDGMGKQNVKANPG